MATSVTQVVIAGGGIVGIPLAYAVKAKLHGKVDVTVVSDGSDFHFVPANPWIALGLRAPEDVTFALEPLLTARKIALRADAIQSIDPERSRLELAGGNALDYDYLVIATGIRPDWNGVPGAVGNPRVQSVIRPTDAVAAYAAYAEFLRHPGPVIVAAAPRVPTIGPMYEYAFLLDADLRRRALRDRVPITLVTPEPYPGHVGLDKPVAREALSDALRREGIEWIGNAALERCEDRTLRFSVHSAQGAPRARSLEFAYATIWPPFRGVDGVASCKALCDADGLVIVDECQRAPGHPNIFALGACTAKPMLTQTPVPVGAPDAVYIGQQQVAVVADNICHSIRGEPLVRASVEREHWIADMGKRGAAYLAAPQMPLRNIQWLHQGRWVYEAKQEFEDYFVNQILFGAGQHGQIAALVRRLRSQPGRAGAAPEGGSELGSQLTFNTDVRRNIEALARHLRIDARKLSQQLLEKAVAEAQSCLDPEMRERVRADVHARLMRELEAKEERERFEGGAP